MVVDFVEGWEVFWEGFRRGKIKKIKKVKVKR